MKITTLEEWVGCFRVDLCWTQPATFLGQFSAAGAGWSRSSNFPIIFTALLIKVQTTLVLKANLYVIIGEFLTKLFQEFMASPLSITERPIWIQ